MSHREIQEVISASSNNTTYIFIYLILFSFDFQRLNSTSKCLVNCFEMQGQVLAYHSSVLGDCVCAAIQMCFFACFSGSQFIKELIYLIYIKSGRNNGSPSTSTLFTKFFLFVLVFFLSTVRLMFLSFFFLLFPRPIPTRPGLTRPTSVPQRCWAVAKRPDAQSMIFLASCATHRQALTCFHHGIDLLGLHTCTYHLPFPL